MRHLGHSEEEALGRASNILGRDPSELVAVQTLAVLRSGEAEDPVRTKRLKQLDKDSAVENKNNALIEQQRFSKEPEIQRRLVAKASVPYAD